MYDNDGIWEGLKFPAFQKAGVLTISAEQMKKERETFLKLKQITPEQRAFIKVLRDWAERCYLEFDGGMSGVSYENLLKRRYKFLCDMDKHDFYNIEEKNKLRQCRKEWLKREKGIQ